MQRGMPDYLIFWEAEYFDRVVLREKDGAKYGQIDRSNLSVFRLVTIGGEVLVKAPMVDGRTGWDLCYRRRITMSARQGGGFQRHTWFLVGFVPMGPVFALDPTNMKFEIAPKFGYGNDLIFSLPLPHPDEGEHFVFDTLGQ